MKRIAICGLSLLLASKIALSQNIEVVNERKLELGLAGKILVENHLTANPNKPGHLLLSGMYADSSKNDLYGNFCATSDNGGETWNNVKAL